MFIYADCASLLYRLAAAFDAAALKEKFSPEMID